MKKIKELNSGCIYLFRGLPSANSFEIESKSEVIIFLRYFNRYLKSYLELLEYCVGKDGWEVIVRIKDKRTLKKYIDKDSKSKNKDQWGVSRIIGERIRVFRLQLRKRLNSLKGRKGNCTQCSFEKFIFDNVDELNKCISRLRKEEVRKGQDRKCFLSDKKNYDVDKQIMKDHNLGISLLSSKLIRSLGLLYFKKVHKFSLEVLNLLHVPDFILSKLVMTTFNSHNT